MLHINIIYIYALHAFDTLCYGNYRYLLCQSWLFHVKYLYLLMWYDSVTLHIHFCMCECMFDVKKISKCKCECGTCNRVVCYVYLTCVYACTHICMYVNARKVILCASESCTNCWFMRQKIHIYFKIYWLIVLIPVAFSKCDHGCMEVSCF